MTPDRGWMSLAVFSVSGRDAPQLAWPGETAKENGITPTIKMIRAVTVGPSAVLAEMTASPTRSPAPSCFFPGYEDEAVPFPLCHPRCTFGVPEDPGAKVNRLPVVACGSDAKSVCLRCATLSSVPAPHPLTARDRLACGLWSAERAASPEVASFSWGDPIFEAFKFGTVFAV